MEYLSKFGSFVGINIAKYSILGAYGIYRSLYINIIHIYIYNTHIYIYIYKINIYNTNIYYTIYMHKIYPSLFSSLSLSLFFPPSLLYDFKLRH